MTRSPVFVGPICLALLAGAIPAASAQAQAQAQAKASAPAPASPSNELVGPEVPGVCLLSREAVFAEAKVGQAISARLQQLSAQAQAEIDDERSPIVTDVKALEAQKASLPAAQFEARSKPLAARWDAVQRKANLRSREIEATRAKALATIGKEAQPIIAQVYASHKCGILFAREAVLGGNPAADLTAAITAGLDAKITTITFQREILPDEAPAAAPLAPAAPKAK